MDTLLTYSGYLLTIFVVVFFHEAGHYFAARLICLHVDKFCIFFDPWFRLISFTIFDTKYILGWLPVGGYVTIDPHLEYKPKIQQIFFYLAGSLGNLFLADNILLFIDFLPYKEWFLLTASCSLGLGLINLIPLKRMDGWNIYKILKTQTP